MDPYINPFSPGAGTPPPELAGRDPIIQMALVALKRIRHGRYSKSLVLVGLRGVGKTVLLLRIWKLAQAEGYRAVLVEAHEDRPLPALLVPALRQALYSLDGAAAAGSKARRALGVLAGFIKSFKAKVGDVELTVEPELGIADSGDLETDLGALLVAVAEAAADHDSGIALCMDEMQCLKQEEFRALIVAIHRISQLNLPLILVGAGLPHIIGLAGKSKSYAERLFAFPELGPLDLEATRDALQAPVESQNVTFTEEAIAEIYRVTQGYPYFLQQWGSEAWNHAQETPIDLPTVIGATRSAIEGLDANFFRVRYERLTHREKHYLRALAELGPGAHLSIEVAELLRLKPASLAPLRSGLIGKGMIYSPAQGDTAFTVPLFDEYLKRMLPEFALGDR